MSRETYKKCWSKEKKNFILKHLSELKNIACCVSVIRSVETKKKKIIFGGTFVILEILVIESQQRMVMIMLENTKCQELQS